LGASIASTGRNAAWLQDDGFLGALDGVADLVPQRRSLEALPPEQQLQAWMRYAAQLESRLQEARQRLAWATRASEVHRVVCRDESAVPAGTEAADDARLESLARVRAEQLMSVRLLDLLARCADLGLLQDPEGEAAAVLDPQRRRELRARDFEESLAEHRALRQARKDGLLRARDGRGAIRLRVPDFRRDMN
jgi:hypothetical protein